MSGFKLKVANSGLDHNSAFRDHLKRGGIRVLYQKKLVSLMRRCTGPIGHGQLSLHPNLKNLGSNVDGTRRMNLVEPCGFLR